MDRDRKTTLARLTKILMQAQGSVEAFRLHTLGVSIPEIEQRLNVSRTTAYRLIEDGAELARAWDARGFAEFVAQRPRRKLPLKLDRWTPTTVGRVSLELTDEVRRMLRDPYSVYSPAGYEFGQAYDALRRRLQRATVRVGDGTAHLTRRRGGT